MNKRSPPIAHRELIDQSFRLGFAASNNEAEYEALIAGLRLAKVVGAKRLQAFCDSQLVASQYSKDYEAKKKRMDAYLSVTKSLAAEFDHFKLTKVPRKDNYFADALAALGSNQRDQVRRKIPIHSVEKPSITLLEGKDILAISSNITEITSSTENGEDWQTPFLDYLNKGILSADKWESRRLKAKSVNYVSIDDRLHRWTANKLLLTCVGKEEAELVIIETREGEEATTAEWYGENAILIGLRVEAMTPAKNYQHLAESYYNRKVRSRPIQLGDLVLRKVFENSREWRAGKLGTNWEGPYKITHVVKPGVYRLETSSSEQIPRSWNSINLKRYFSA
ncbi:hypothetical protein N665_0061s0011 [Sinapis alba]|nr:hypothetical protein N665_0061s0011 [Sinapis alba]